jgi:predicted transcriptional regulator
MYTAPRLLSDARIAMVEKRASGALVAGNIRRLRAAKGLSQEVLAMDAEIDRTYVSRLERGLENPTVAVLAASQGALVPCRRSSAASVEGR